MFRSRLHDIQGEGVTCIGNPVALHFGMFLEAVQAQGTEEQQREWVDKIKAMSIIGAYAQTELGHGTFVRGLETTAEYDPETEEFVVNTPQLSSMKWWPGGRE